MAGEGSFLDRALQKISASRLLNCLFLYTGFYYIVICLNPPMAWGREVVVGCQQVFPIFFRNGKSFSCKLNFKL